MVVELAAEPTPKRILVPINSHKITHEGPYLNVKYSGLPLELQEQIRKYDPRTNLGKLIKTILHLLPTAVAGDLLDELLKTVVIQSSLSLTVLRFGRVLEPLGIVGNKVITTAGVGFLVDAWQNLVELEDMKYHALGTGSTAEAVGDTALVTELTTEYTGNVRATGTTTEASATVFETVATNTLDGTPGAALREHGIFNQAATGGGVLWDRTVFSAITLSSGDGLQSTYDMTASAGG